MQRFAVFLRSNLRAGDTCRRCEDERFVIVLPEQNTDTARVVAKRLIQGAGTLDLGDDFPSERRSEPLTVSIVEMSRQGASDGEELLRASRSDSTVDLRA